MQEKLLIVNDARLHLYTVLWHVFSESASATQVEVVFGGATIDALSIFEDSDNDAYASAFNDIRALQKNFAAKDSSELQTKCISLEADYSRLFIGPQTVLAPQWESVYTSPKRLLFQQSTLKVREFFSSEGYVFSGYPNEPDDSLTAELDFIRQLAINFNDSAEDANYKECLRLIEVQKEFLINHLLLWIDDFVQALNEANADLYYHALARMLAEFIKVDVAALEQISSAIQEGGLLDLQITADKKPK